MTAAVLAGLVLVTITAPHLLSLRRAEPAVAIALWSASLTLRALLGLFVALWLILYMPATELFSIMAHWCWHGALPLMATHLGLSGHRVVDAAIVLPALLLATSLMWVGFASWRVARGVRRVVAMSAIGAGPRDSVIVGGPEVLVAAAGVARPRVLVSAGALTQLDDEELAAALDHERGHIAHRHRFVLMHAQICRAAARFVPGTRLATRELSLHLERDADRWALRRHDRFALASAILKAAGSRAPLVASGAVASLAGESGVEARLGELVGRPPSSSLRRGALRAIAAFAVVLTVGVAGAVPPTVAAGLQRQPVTVSHPCPG